MADPSTPEGQRTTLDLNTVDQEKKNLFEMDPCGMEAEWTVNGGPEYFFGKFYGRGNCTGPDECTCTCFVGGREGTYQEGFHRTAIRDEKNDEDRNEDPDALMDWEKEEPWEESAWITLPPGVTYGTKLCAKGYEGNMYEDGRIDNTESESSSLRAPWTATAPRKSTKKFMTCHLIIKYPTIPT